jgi:hypothetical protein
VSNAEISVGFITLPLFHFSPVGFILKPGDGRSGLPIALIALCADGADPVSNLDRRPCIGAVNLSNFP